jgi:hypothetical protein
MRSELEAIDHAVRGALNAALLNLVARLSMPASRRGCPEGELHPGAEGALQRAPAREAPLRASDGRSEPGRSRVTYSARLRTFQNFSRLATSSAL